ncbi:MAG: ribosome recycling factor [Saprospiraceae bacterium]|nr:ribosome recycling factor [Saprospiraceae bacterium]
MSDMTIEQFLQKGKQSMEDSIEHLRKELAKIRAGKASPSMVNGLMVEHYGTQMPINQVANVNAVDSKTLAIQPWDKTALEAIERAIFEANLGVTPQNDGEFVRITMPALTEERRKELVKYAKGHAEESRVSIRNIRHKLMDFIKKEVKEGYPEDAGKRKEKQVQDMVEKYSKEIENLLESKEQDIMTV